MNRESARFCAECATPLGTTCAACGHSIDPGAKFCDQCGARVVQASGRADPGARADVDRRDEPGQTPGSSAVRKTVTVLFCDLVGSTAFGEQVDAESAREAIGRYHAMARSAIEDAGGVVEKFIGDGVMALFGVPEMAEDDAHRAVAAGLALHRGFASIRDAIAERHGPELGLRVGINTGEVVIAEGDADLVGDPINTAARLEAACPPGSVLVGQDTWRLTRSAFPYEVLGDVEVKGKAAPLTTYRVATGPADPTRARDDDASTPFVGRVTELAQLRELFDDVERDARIGLATVVGAPGVGKTRLMREFGAGVVDRVSVVELRFERSGSSTFAPVAQLLRSVVDLPDDLSSDEVRRRVHGLVADLDDADRVADLLASFVGATPVRSTEEAFFAVRRLLEALGRRSPLVVVIDDVQWAEPLFLDLIEHLADWTADTAVLIVCLARPELRELRPSLAGEGRRELLAISLEGLDETSTATLAARLIGADTIPGELMSRLPASTEGNPLFVREFMRMLVDDGVLQRDRGGWELTIDVDAIEVPPTIQSLLAIRVERLTPRERHLVERASVVGTEFPLGAVLAISGDPDTVDHVRATIDQLHRRELLEPTGTYWGDEPVFRFHHVLIRDAAYRRLLKRTRADLHVQVAVWLEQASRQVVGDHEVVIGHHFEQAHHYGRELDDRSDETATHGRRAATLLGLAADRSLRRDDASAAAGLAERALACLPDDDPSAPELLVVAVEALLALRDVTTARPLVERLQQAAGSDERLSAWGECFAAQVEMLTDPDSLRDVERRSDLAAHRLADLGDDAGVAKARYVRAGAVARLGQVGRCEAELDAALAAAREADDQRRVATVLGAAPLAALWGPSPIPRAGGRCLDVIRLLRITTGSPSVEATSIRCQAVLEALRQRFDTARSMLAEARATVVELGLEHAVCETDLFRGIVELLADDAEAAEAPLRSAYAGLGQIGVGADAGQAAGYLSRALLAQGRLDEAEEWAGIGDRLAGSNPQTAISARAVQAEVLIARGRIDDALELAGEAVEVAADTDLLIDQAYAFSVLAHVHRAAGDLDAAERAASEAAARYAQKSAVVDTSPPPDAPVTEVGVAPETDREASDEAGGPTVPVELDEGRLGRIPTDDLDPAPEDLPPRTTAERAVDALCERLNRGDVGLEFLSDEFQRHDRRSLVGLPATDRSHYAEAARSVIDLGAVWSAPRTLARRDDNFVMSEVDVTYPDGSVMPLIGVLRVGHGGLIDLIEIYEPEQLTEAYQSLMDRWAETLEPGQAAVLRAVALMRQAIQSSDPEPLSRSVAPDITYVDHRRLGGSTRTLDEFVRYNTEINPVAIIASDILMLSDRVVASTSTLSFDHSVEAHEPADRSAGSPDRWMINQHAVLLVRDGRVVRIETFDVDDRDRALARARELDAMRDRDRALERAWELDRSASSGPLRNRAVDLLERVIDTQNAQGPIDEMLADDYLRVDHRPVVGMPPADGAGYLRMLEDMYALDACWQLGETLAIRGERFCLVELSVGYGDERHHVDYMTVMEIDEQDRARRVAHFEPDAMAEAHDELHRWWIESLDPEQQHVARIATTLRRAVEDADADAIRAAIADDFVLEDRRTLGFGRQTRDDFITSQSGDAPMVFSPQVHLVTGRVIVVSLVMAFDAPNPTAGRDEVEGERTRPPGWELANPTVSVVEHDRVVRMEIFDEDDLGDALERARELDQQAPAIELDNAAVRFGHDMSRRFMLGEISAAVLADDFVRVDRRPVVGMPPAGREEFVRTQHQIRELGAVRVTLRPIAIRGDRLALVHAVVDYRGGAELEWLTVCALDEFGTCRRWIDFEPEQLAEAQDELDRLWYESLPDDVRAFRELFQETAKAVGRLDLELWEHTLSDDLVSVDHRPLGFGTRTKEQFIDAQRARRATTGPGVFLTTDYVFEQGPVAANRWVFRTRNDRGQQVESAAITVAAFAGGQGIRLDIFAAEQLDEALRTAEQLAQEFSTDRRHALSNDATRFVELVMSERSTGADITGRFEAATLAANPVTLTRAASHGRPTTCRPIAIRGDRFALSLVVVDDAHGSTLEWLTVCALEEFGTCHRWIDFEPEQLAEAQDELDRLWLESLPDDVRALRRLTCETNKALGRLDVEFLERVLSDDLVCIDHKPLGWGRRTKEQFIDSQRARRATTGPGVFLTPEYVFEQGPVVVGRYEFRMRNDRGQQVETAGISVGAIDGGQIVRMEVFLPDQLDAAVRLARDLGTESEI